MRTSATWVFVIGLIAVVSLTAIGDESCIRDGRFIARGTPFSLGPYTNPLWPSHVELHFAGGDTLAAAPAVAVELDGDDREIAVYSCVLRDAPGKPGKHLASFLPYPLPGGDTEWPAGRVRRFRLQPATEQQAESIPELTVERSDNELAVGNRWYRISLAPIEGPLAGHARKLIRKITFANGREFAPRQTVSNLSVRHDGSEKIRNWHFDPERPPTWERHGRSMATATYHGGYDGVDVPWRAEFTFYADRPLIRIRFERQRRDERNLRFGLGRTMQVYFHPDAPSWPVAKNQVGQSRNNWVSLSIHEAPAGQIAFLLPDRQTSGLTHWSATWGYLCPSWEASGYRPFRTGAEDIREFYLMLTSEPEPGESLGRRVTSFQTLSEADWHARIHALFAR